MSDPPTDPAHPLSPSLPGRAVRAWMAPLLAAVLTGLYMAPWWNRYLGLSLDGYLPLYGRLILDGMVPYRDFFLHIPPLNPLLDAAIQAIAGQNLAAIRLVGVAERMLLAALLTAWLARSFRPAFALGAALLSLWLSSCGDTEILDLYNQHAMFFAVGAGFAASLALDKPPGRRRLEWLAGFLTGLAFWTKQTAGLGATVGIPAAWILLALASRQDRVALGGRLLRYAGGWILCALPTLAWLGHHEALAAFVQQVFVDAGHSKGSTGRLLLRPWIGAFDARWLTVPAVASIAAVLCAVASLKLLREPPSAQAAGARALAAAAMSALVLLVSAHLGILAWLGARWLMICAELGVFLSLYGMPAVLALLLAQRFRCTWDARQRGVLLFAMLATALGATFALSFPGEPAAATPGFALLIAVVLEARPRRPWLAPVRWGIVAAAVGSVVAAVNLQLLRPFDFAHWKEPPVRGARLQPASAPLRALRLSPLTHSAADRITETIQRASVPGEAIFTFPVYPIFHWLADRPLSTFAILHWFDVTPDRVVDQDTQRVLAARPPVVVAQWVGAESMDLHERYFRRGQESALHRMQNHLLQMLREDYVRVGAWQPADECPYLELWVRGDRAREHGLTADTWVESATAP